MNTSIGNFVFTGVVSNTVLYPYEFLSSMMIEGKVPDTGMSNTMVLRGMYNDNDLGFVYKGFTAKLIYGMVGTYLKIPMRSYLLRQLQYSPIYPKKTLSREPKGSPLPAPHQELVTALANSISSSVSNIILNPFTLCKIAMQLDLPKKSVNLRECMSYLISEYGLSFLYKGAILSGITSFLHHFILSLVYCKIKDYIFTNINRTEAKRGRTEEERAIIIQQQKSRLFSLSTSLFFATAISSIIIFPLYSVLVKYQSAVLTDNHINPFEFIWNNINFTDLKGITSFCISQSWSGVIQLILCRLTCTFHQKISSFFESEFTWRDILHEKIYGREYN
eukprot:TRINITY_DN5706_c0_g1_i1.p1 TRINITY_DN5706_c0_g1~~TRINITY_DN5706_c0_g1_i1.p1  ORF type:complete len:334 (+),score=38.17 TRINITY_DN5706_c0_g1_i1:83-1084(+)